MKKAHFYIFYQNPHFLQLEVLVKNFIYLTLYLTRWLNNKNFGNLKSTEQELWRFSPCLESVQAQRMSKSTNVVVIAMKMVQIGISLKNLNNMPYNDSENNMSSKKRAKDAKAHLSKSSENGAWPKMKGRDGLADKDVSSSSRTAF